MSHRAPRVPQGRTALSPVDNCKHLNKVIGHSLPATEVVFHQRSTDAAVAIAEVVAGTEEVVPAMAVEEAEDAVDDRLRVSILNHQIVKGEHLN